MAETQHKVHQLRKTRGEWRPPYPLHCTEKDQVLRNISQLVSLTCLKGFQWQKPMRFSNIQSWFPLVKYMPIFLAFFHKEFFSIRGPYSLYTWGLLYQVHCILFHFTDKYAKHYIPPSFFHLSATSPWLHKITLENKNNQNKQKTQIRIGPIFQSNCCSADQGQKTSINLS